ncbi:MAG: SCO family protein [Magnetovibrionaceae bacterium]
MPAIIAVVALVVMGALAVQRFVADDGSVVGSEAGDVASSGGAGETSGKARIGGPFHLVDHQGQTVTSATYSGQFMLIYFGYTFCPDICPTSLTTMSEALDLAGAAADNVQPLFITVDPERDTVEHMAEYVGYFHPRLIGLTGSSEQVRQAAKAYRVYSAKVDEDENDPGAYLMDHSSIIYLMGPDGAFVHHFNHEATPEDVAKKLKELT